MNSKETLKKLHKRFPLMTLDELFDILDCYVEDSFFSYKPAPWYVSTCSNPAATSKPENVLTKINYDATGYTNGSGDIQLTASH